MVSDKAGEHQYHIIEVQSGGLQALSFSLSQREQLKAIMSGIVSTMEGIWKFRMWHHRGTRGAHATTPSSTEEPEEQARAPIDDRKIAHHDKQKENLQGS